MELGHLRLNSDVLGERCLVSQWTTLAPLAGGTMGVELFGAAEASLLEHYLDTVEHLPDDVQRTISLLREIDHKYQKFLGKYIN